MNILEDWKKQTLTAQDISTIFKCGKNLAYKLIEKEEFHSVKIGSSIRVSMKSFDNWIQKNDFTLDKESCFDDQVYTIEEIREILNIGKNASYDLLEKNHFKMIRLGKAIRISKKSFDEWLN